MHLLAVWHLNSVGGSHVSIELTWPGLVKANRNDMKRKKNM